MIKSLRLKNFRNFKNKEFIFENEKFFIVGENGKGKTNILEALSLLNNNSIIGINYDLLVKNNENNFFIEYENEKGDTFSIYYDKKLKKKKFSLNKKSINKKNFISKTNFSVIFSPITMNIMYLSPSLRRDFLDQILINSYENYEKLLNEYKKILKNRNKVLKNIYENKSKKVEINFWNEKFINISEEIYKYRFKLINFFKEHIKKSLEYFLGKIEKIEFKYISKVEEDNIKINIKNYLEKNFERDIILGKTNIGPHIDDFSILVDDINLINFASRGETKSIIVWLKLLETAFIEKISGKKPILLIDDLLSELDEIHKNILINRIKYYQTFITTINNIDTKEKHLILK